MLKKLLVQQVDKILPGEDIFMDQEQGQDKLSLILIKYFHSIPQRRLFYDIYPQEDNGKQCLVGRSLP